MLVYQRVHGIGAWTKTFSWLSDVCCKGLEDRPHKIRGCFFAFVWEGSLEMCSLMFCQVYNRLNGWSFHKMNLRHLRFISYPDSLFYSMSIHSNLLGAWRFSEVRIGGEMKTLIFTQPSNGTNSACSQNMFLKQPSRTWANYCLYQPPYHQL